MVVYNTDINEYEIISLLSQCFEGFAEVHLARHTRSDTMVAIKRFHMDKLKENTDLVEREIILTRQLQHPHILECFVSFVHEQRVHVVSPLMAYGSCRDLLNAHFNEGLPESAIVLIVKDVFDALDYIHKKGIIHRSIRASHILISENGRVRLSGLRYAKGVLKDGRWQKQVHSFPASTLRNLNWLSPELLEQNMDGYNQKSDIYSCGMLLCELANGTEPFSGVATTLMLINKVKGCVPQLLDASSVEPQSESNEQGDGYVSKHVMSRRFSEDLHELTALCLQKDPYMRPNALQLLSHPIFKAYKRSGGGSSSGGLYLPDILKPALPLSNRVAIDTEEVADLDMIQHFYDLEMNSYEWDF